MIDPYALSPDEIAEALDRVRVIRAWCDGIEAAARAAMLAGQEVPGYRLGFNHPKPKWVDEVEVVEAMSDANVVDALEYMPPKVLPPGKMRELLKKFKAPKRLISRINSLVTRNVPELVVTEIDNTYYSEVNAVDLAAWQGKQSGSVAVTKPRPRKSKSQ
jgi:hypothetical protein